MTRPLHQPPAASTANKTEIEWCSFCWMNVPAQKKTLKANWMAVKVCFSTRNRLSCVQRITFECIFSRCRFPVISTAFSSRFVYVERENSRRSSAGLGSHEPSTILFHTLLIAQVPSYATVSYFSNFPRWANEYETDMNCEKFPFTILWALIQCKSSSSNAKVISIRISNRRNDVLATAAASETRQNIPNHTAQRTEIAKVFTCSSVFCTLPPCLIKCGIFCRSLFDMFVLYNVQLFVAMNFEN